MEITCNIKIKNGQTYEAVFIRQLCFICGFYCQINNLSGELVKLPSGAREGGGRRNSSAWPLGILPQISQSGNCRTGVKSG